MTTIYFIRHAQPDVTIHEDAIRPLNEKGLQDRNLICDFLLNKNIDIIFSSPFKRTQETIFPFAQKQNLEINFVDDLRERQNGVWVEDINLYYKQQWTDFNFKLENGESLLEVQTRIINAIKNIVLNNQNKNIVISTHGFALSSAINYYDNSFKLEQFLKIVRLMPFISEFTFDDANNCTSITITNPFTNENVYDWQL